MNEQQIYFLGLITLPVLFGLLAAFFTVKEALSEWWASRTIHVYALAYCPVSGCGYSAASGIFRGQKRSAKRMVREHLEEGHKSAEGESDTRQKNE